MQLTTRSALFFSLSLLFTLGLNSQASAQATSAELDRVLKEAHLPADANDLDISEVTLKGLVQTYILAETLQAEFDALIDRGGTLERMSKVSISAKGRGKPTVYAQIMALREIQETLEHVFLDKTTLTTAQFSEKINELKEFANDPTKTELIELAFFDLQDLVSQMETGNSSAPDATVQAKRLEELRHVRSAKLWLGANPLIRKFSKNGINVLNWTNVEAKRYQLEMKATFDASERSPGQEVPFKIFPSTGNAGNITGSGFPKGTWSITYDDGPAGTTGKVLENLKKHNINATFYMLSQQIDHPGKLRTYAVQEILDGNDSACHSYTHPQVPKLSTEKRKREIETAAQVYASVISKGEYKTDNNSFLYSDTSRPRFFRLPYGAGVSVPAVREDLKKSCMVHVFWNVDTLDWHDKDPEVIYARAVKQVNSLGRGIILFHDIHAQSVVASEKLMTYLQSQNGVRIAKVSDVVKEINGGRNWECKLGW